MEGIQKSPASAKSTKGKKALKQKRKTFRKLQKLNMGDLKPSSSSQRGNVKLKHIGEIYQRAYLTSAESDDGAAGDSQIEKGDTSLVTHEDDDVDIKGIQNGNIGHVVIRCCITDNRVGRLPKDKRGSYEKRFLKIADHTGTLDILVHSRESGVDKLDLKDDNCTPEARCYANVEIGGIVAWGPRKHNQDRAQFYLNKPCYIKAYNSSCEWNEETQLGFPSSEVCKLLAFSSFSSFHTVTGLCGKVDMLKAYDGIFVLISVSDAVGYIAIEFDVEGFKKDHRVPDDIQSGDEDDATVFTRHFNIQQGRPFFLKGPLYIAEHVSGKVAVLKVKGSDVDIVNVSEDAYKSFRKRLCAMDPLYFMGNEPEHSEDEITDDV